GGGAVGGVWARLGGRHPRAPFPDGGPGSRPPAGKPAVLLAEPRGARLLLRLALRLSMLPLVSREGDRVLYHAACALAANGLTALYGAADRVLQAASVPAPGEPPAALRALMAAALDACAGLGAAGALSGPVARGDAATVALHREALARIAPPLDQAYRALMVEALELAVQRGLPGPAAASVSAALRPRGA